MGSTFMVRALSALAILATIIIIGCDPDSPPPPAAPPTGSGDLDGGGSSGSSGSSGASSGLPPPGPGPAVISLPLPNAFAFITTKEGKPQAIGEGFRFMPVTVGDGTLADLDRASFWVELNASLAGRKANAIPVRLRPFAKGQPLTSFICAREMSGTSGQPFLVLDQFPADTKTGNPANVQEDLCNWFLVERKDRGERRFQPMIFREGKEAYLSALEADASAGHRVRVAASASDTIIYQLVTPDKNGLPLPP
jgi:hypothetical protein